MFESRQLKISVKQVVENEDLLIEILKLLPAKSLWSSRLVCKHWRSLISSFEFRRIWCSVPRNLKPIGFLLCRSYRTNPWKFLYLGDKDQAIRMSSYPDWSPYSDFPHDKLRIVQSCNGLILCFYKDVSRRDIRFVCNPTTKKVVQLNLPGNGFPILGLAFDPKISPHYKVLCLKYLDHRVYVYSSELRVWRTTEPTISIPFGETRMSHYAYCKGVMCWMHRIYDFLWCFDVKNDKLERLRLPSSQRDLNFCYMGVCVDRLCLVGQYLLQEEYKYIMYETETNGSGWVVKHRIKVDGVLANHLLPRWSRALCVYQDENGELNMVFSVLNEIVAFSFHSMIVKKFPRSARLICSQAFEHCETLYSV